MSVSPPASPGSSSSSALLRSPHVATSQTSAPPLTPCKGNGRNLVWSSLPAFGDSDDDDEENVDPRFILSQDTPKRKISKKHTTSSPSKFVVKGTVTPSRAAPLFVRYSTNKKTLKRAAPDTESSASDEDDGYDEVGADSDIDMLHSLGEAGSDRYYSSSILPSKPRHAKFLPIRTAQNTIATTHCPLINTFRPFQPTENTAAYLMAVRSNSLHHLPSAASLRGNIGGSFGRGVLGVSRMLGAGGGMVGGESNMVSQVHNNGQATYTLSLFPVSQRPLYMSLETMGHEMEDLYGLPSSIHDDALAHPLCAEYSYCALVSLTQNCKGC